VCQQYIEDYHDLDEGVTLSFALTGERTTGFAEPLNRCGMCLMNQLRGRICIHLSALSNDQAVTELLQASVLLPHIDHNVFVGQCPKP
jgi:hypothetical protein